RRVLFRSLAEFRAYVREMLDSLEVGDVGRDLARAVFWPPVPANRAPIISLYRTAVFGTLPDGLRRQFACPWGRPQRRLFVGGSYLARLGAPVADQLFFAVAHGQGRGGSAALALAGVR